MCKECKLAIDDRFLGRLAPACARARPHVHACMLVKSNRDSVRKAREAFTVFTVFNLKAYGGRSFVLASAVLWNDLPQSIKDSQSVETFKQKLKTHLFLQSYNGQ